MSTNRDTYNDPDITVGKKRHDNLLMAWLFLSLFILELSVLTYIFN